jgi:hypothetical protein
LKEEGQMDDDDNKTGFFSRIKSLFHKKESEEEQMYKRKLMDRKIERYLDNNFDSFIAEYGMVREFDLFQYEERHATLATKLKVLNDFAREADSQIGNLEGRIEHLKKGIKGYKG